MFREEIISIIQSHRGRKNIFQLILWIPYYSDIKDKDIHHKKTSTNYRLIFSQMQKFLNNYFKKKITQHDQMGFTPWIREWFTSDNPLM